MCIHIYIYIIIDTHKVDQHVYSFNILQLNVDSYIVTLLDGYLACSQGESTGLAVTKPHPNDAVSKCYSTCVFHMVS